MKSFITTLAVVFCCLAQAEALDSSDVEFRDATDICYAAADESGFDDYYDEYVEHCSQKFENQKFKLGDIASMESIDAFTASCESKNTDDNGEINESGLKQCLFQHLDSAVAKMAIK
jgi:hypothetical protein